MPTKHTVQRGDTWEKTFTATQNGSPFDLSSVVQIWFTIRTKPATTLDIDDTNAVVQLTVGNGISVVSAAGGVIRFVLEPAQTKLLVLARYYWDVSFRLADGRVKTPDKGPLEVEWEATVST